MASWHSKSPEILVLVQQFDQANNEKEKKNTGPYYWHFMMGIHQWPVAFIHNDQWCAKRHYVFTSSNKKWQCHQMLYWCQERKMSN